MILFFIEVKIIQADGTAQNNGDGAQINFANMCVPLILNL